jgi:hypothetical protein
MGALYGTDAGIVANLCLRRVVAICGCCCRQEDQRRLIARFQSRMPDKPLTPARLPETIDDLRQSAERCRRLAASITDRQTHDRLLEMARECEERAEALEHRG